MPDGKTIVLKGKPPEGAKILADGPGSAYKTTQVIGGRLRRTITQQHGAVTASITPSGKPKGVDIRFRPTGGRPAPRPKAPRRAKAPKSPSVRIGRQFFTKMGRHTLISRRPLGRRRR